MNEIPYSYWMIPKAREVFEEVQRALFYFDTVDKEAINNVMEEIERSPFEEWFNAFEKNCM